MLFQCVFSKVNFVFKYSEFNFLFLYKFLMKSNLKWTSFTWDEFWVQHNYMQYEWLEVKIRLIYYIQLFELVDAYTRVYYVMYICDDNIQ